MKKALSILLALMLMFAAAVSVAAYADAKFDTSAPSGLGTQVFKASGRNEDISVYGGNNSGISNKLESFCNKAEGYVGYEFDAPKDGTYSFVIEYIARAGKNRYQGYSLDSETGTLKTIDLEENDARRFATVTEELTAGKHTFFFRAPENFDDSAVKSCDIYGLTVYLTKEAATTTETVPAAEPSVATSDSAVIALAVCAVSAAAAAVVIRKKR